MTIRTLDAARNSLKATSLSLKFHSRIIGQPEATQALLNVIEKFQSGFYDRSKPIASLLFLGPTGVGKTGTVEAFVEGLFGKPTAMMKVDCAEYQHSHEIAKLLGSPPGYLGHRETHPFFTNAAVQGYKTADVPFTVILFDEIEKANDALWNLLLGILDKGQVTTGTNEVVDLRATIIIMTSNVGSKELAKRVGDGAIGFNIAGEDVNHEEATEIAMSAARRKFMPEFLNRLDNVTMFNTLTPENLDEIFTLELNKIRERIVMTSLAIFEVEISPAAKKQILLEGYDKKYNARNLKRTMEHYISLPLARLVATGQVINNDVVICDYRNGKWEYYAKGEVAGQPTTGGLSKGRLALPTVQQPQQSPPAPPDVPKPWRNPYDRESDNIVCDVPSNDPRRKTDGGSDRPRWWIK
jgi:ATP-dependent Clp protease ATP-binding subunit ClpB